MLTCCPLYQQGETAVKFESKYTSFFQHNAREDIVCKIVVIFFSPQCVIQALNFSFCDRLTCNNSWQNPKSGPVVQYKTSVSPLSELWVIQTAGRNGHPTQPVTDFTDQSNQKPAWTGNRNRSRYSQIQRRQRNRKQYSKLVKTFYNKLLVPSLPRHHIQTFIISN